MHMPGRARAEAATGMLRAIHVYIFSLPSLRPFLDSLRLFPVLHALPPRSPRLPEYPSARIPGLPAAFTPLLCARMRGVRESASGCDCCHPDIEARSSNEGSMSRKHIAREVVLDI